MASTAINVVRLGQAALEAYKMRRPSGDEAVVWRTEVIEILLYKPERKVER